ncbi:MAG: hypothetical protein ACRDP6_02305 [Actinoallomurus sp.]
MNRPVARDRTAGLETRRTAAYEPRRAHGRTYGGKARPARHGATLLAAVALLTACSPGSHPAPELTGTRLVTAQSTTSWIEKPDDMRVRDFHDRGLVGPHYTLGFSWVAAGRELGAAYAGRLGIQPVRAPRGKELIVAAVSPKATAEAFMRSKPVSVVGFVDGTATPIVGLPLADAGVGTAPTTELILISAAPRAAVRLRVTDTGRSQEIDLRTGATSGEGYTQRDSSPATWNGESRVVVPSPVPGLGAGALSVSDPISTRPDTDRASLTDYQGGWAPPGRAFLTVPVPNLSWNLLATGYIRAKSDDATTFSFTPVHGKAIPAEAGKRSMGLLLPGLADVPTVVFRVPDTITGGTVALDLRKARLVDGDGGTASWIRPPHAFRLKLTFPR